jgi:hypothetical protein
MTEHITKYQAGLFEGLINWSALDKWNINTEEGQNYLSSAFGEEFLIETLDVDSYLWASHRKTASTEYKTFKEYI